MNHIDKLNSVFRQHNAIDAVLIYGSRAKGNYRSGSDIDLAIKGSTLTFAELMQIEDQIDGLYLPYTVGLSQYNQPTHPDLIAHIDRVGIVIYDGYAVVREKSGQVHGGCNVKHTERRADARRVIRQSK